MQIDEVVSFWFGEGVGPWEIAAEVMKRWFMGGFAFDEEVRSRFSAAIEAARRGDLDAWTETPRGTLALLLLLDQLTRNAFRGTPLAFSGDAKALAVAREAVDADVDQALRPLERPFLYLPFEHAEDLADQRRAVALFQRLAEENPDAPFAQQGLGYAEKHREIVARFGRFPHRNAILGRDSTDEELAFLKEPGSSF